MMVSNLVNPYDALRQALGQEDIVPSTTLKNQCAFYQDLADIYTERRFARAFRVSGSHIQNSSRATAPGALDFESPSSHVNKFEDLPEWTHNSIRRSTGESITALG
jgi:hypothetical protein